MMSEPGPRATHNPPCAGLVFDLFTGIIRGRIDPTQRPFALHGFSGGGRGHLPIGRGLYKVTPAQAKQYLFSDDQSLRSELANTREIRDAQGHYIQRGGPLPPGRYLCHFIPRHPPFIGPVVALVPTKLRDGEIEIDSPFASMPIYLDRGGFYIHGSGPRGSDGCIVIHRSLERARLFREIHEYEKNFFPKRVGLTAVGVPYELPAERYVGNRA